MLRVKQVLLSVNSKIYQSCSELPLFNFIKVLVTGELKYLIIKGRPSNESLASAWDNIFNEYTTLCGGLQQNHILLLLKEIAVTQNKLIIIQAIIDQLSKQYNSDLADMLRALGFRRKFDPQNREEYTNDLKLTVSQAKTLMVRLEQRKAELNNMRSGNEVKESDYDSLIAELSKFQGYRIHTKEIMVSEFISIFNNYKKSLKPDRNGK